MMELRVQCCEREERLRGDSFQQLREAARSAFSPHLDTEDFHFASSSAAVTNDLELAAARDGDLLFVVSAADQSLLGGSVKERINFVPHPKTLTHAGDYEYFADQGQHPLPYAIAELVDNSLQATRMNHVREAPRDVEVTFLVGHRGESFISVWDNGSGMSSTELSQWAVMNLSVSDRPQAATLQATPSQVAHKCAQRAPPPSERYLSGELSYFGVGSKNASFFMGRFVKVQTKTADSSYVHEICLRADSLEQRYRDGEPVYEEDLVHRNPGDAGSLSELEQGVPSIRKWVQAEGSGPASFTRVIIGMLKESIAEMILDDAEGAALCDELAHLYHYYLHGSSGNTPSASAGSPSQPCRTLPGGQLLPHITLQYVYYTRDSDHVRWRRELREVDTDMESLYLRHKKADFKFSLQVPDKGVVDGVLYYFPYENGAETLPEDKSLVRKSADVFTLTQQQQRSPEGPVLTQTGKNLGSQAVTLLPAECQSDESEGGEEAARRRRGPVLATFWQGRLIPATRIESLPFVEATRTKRTAAARDILPDEVFSRLRGALFFGPNFLVTRNKLNFRDNLQELLGSALPVDRGLERRFREWLTAAHATLDKNIRFENMANSQDQAAARKTYGENATLFHTITDNSRVICTGNVVRLATRPVVIGRVVHFRVGQVAHAEGCYSNGLVQVAPLPEEVFGKEATFTHQLRRIDEVLTEEEAAEYSSRETAKLPAKLCIDPIRLAADTPSASIRFVAGESIPETSITVLNHAGAKVTVAHMSGQRRPLAVTQTLHFLRNGSVGGEGGDAVEEDKENQRDEGNRPLKKRQKGRKGGGGVREAAEGEARALIEVFNKQPSKEGFVFQRVQDALRQAGLYVLEYRLSPELPSGTALRHTVQIEVAAGPPVAVRIQGEGRAFALQNEVHMGEPMPPITLTLVDANDNRVGFHELGGEPCMDVCASWPAQGELLEMKPIADLSVEWDSMEILPGGSMAIRGLRLLGPDTSCFPLSIFDQEGPRGTQRSAQLSQVGCSQAAARVGAADVVLMMRLMGVQREGSPAPGLQPAQLELSLRPGLPAAVSLCPRHPFTHDAVDSETGEGAPGIQLQLGAPIPSFRVAVTDRWNNPTGGSDRLEVRVQAECASLLPPPSHFAFDARSGSTAEVTGLQASSHLSLAGAVSPLELRVICSSECETLRECLAVHPSPLPTLRCVVEVEKRAVATSLRLYQHGEKLPLLEGDGMVASDGSAFWIADVEAGSMVDGLEFALLDQDGNLLSTPAKGKVSCSWMQGSKKVKWVPGEAEAEASLLPLEALQAPECVVEPAICWVRMSLDKGSGGVVLDSELQVHARPSSPASWGISVVGAGVTTQDGADLSCVVAGEPCCLEVEALDRFHNRCTKSSQGGAELPTPVISVEGSPQLEYNPAEWEVYSLRVTVGGPVGAVQLVVCDRAGKSGASLLAEDSLSLELTHGRPCQLAVQPGWRLLGGLKSSLKDLAVQVCDAYGNCCHDVSLEVTMQPSALSQNDDSAAASVSAVGGNRLKLKKGAGVFEHVKLAAKSAGTYVLSIGSGSRKVALEACQLCLELKQANSVSQLALSVGAASMVAGEGMAMAVAVSTEDGLGLPCGVIAESLRVRMESPGGKKSVMLLPVISDDRDESACYSEVQFDTGPLKLAGGYTATAEYLETRPEILASASRATEEQVKRSNAISLQVQPSVAVAVTLEGGAYEPLSASNGPNPEQRLLLPRAVFQARDEFQNSCSAENAAFRVALKSATSEEDPSVGGGHHQAPELECEHAQPGTSLSLDANGRLFLGDIALREGTGRAGGQGTTRLQLSLEAKGLISPGDGWRAVWTVEVFFSDDSARYARLQELTGRRGQLADSLRRSERRQTEAEQRLADASSKRDGLVSELGGLLAEAQAEGVGSAKEAEGQLKKLRAEIAIASDPKAAVREARYGHPKDPRTGKHNPTVAAIRVCLAQLDPGVVGVLASLATVQSDDLARALGAGCSSALATLVLTDGATRQRLSAVLSAKKLRRCDMLALSMINNFRGDTGDATAGYENVTDLARRLHWEACVGCDPALLVRLPHMNGRQQQRSAPTWPSGFVGFAVNLARPTSPNTRATCLFAIFSTMMLFETLEQAEEYRELVCGKMGVTCATICTFDCNMITSSGIIRELSWRKEPLERIPYMLGSASPGEQPELVGCRARLEALSRALPLLRDMEELDAEMCEAEAEVSAVRDEVGGDTLESLRDELARIDAELAEHEGIAAVNGATAGNRRKRGGGADGGGEDDGGGKASRTGRKGVEGSSRARRSRRTSGADPCEVIQDSDAVNAAAEAGGGAVEEEVCGSAAAPSSDPAVVADDEQQVGKAKGGAAKKRRRRR